MADVIDDAEMAAQRLVRIGDRNVRELSQFLDPGAGIQMTGEIVDRLVGGLEETVRFGLKRKLDGASGAVFEGHEMGDDVYHMIGVALDHAVVSHARLEPGGG